VSEQVASPSPEGAPQSAAPASSGNKITRWFKGLSTFGKIRIVLAIIVVLVVVPWAIIAGSDEPGRAAVGDCMVGQTADDMKVVECTDPTAEWTVVGRVEDKTEAEFTDNSCDAFPSTDVAYYQAQKRGGLAGLIQGDPKGFILCLTEK
jgi:hypothetical protein